MGLDGKGRRSIVSITIAPAQNREPLLNFATQIFPSDAFDDISEEGRIRILRAGDVLCIEK